ncbi:MAG: hypothetical protein ACR2JY_12515 [Chloroflexota bacterium]
MDAVIAGQVLAGLTAVILLRRLPRLEPALIPARVRTPRRRRVPREDE